MKQSYRAGVKLASLLASVSVLGAGMLVAQPAAWAEDAKPAAETAKAKDGAADFLPNRRA